MNTVAAAVVSQLKALGVKRVFGIPGGPWIPFMESMRNNGMDFILVSNEASAGFMADVTARLTGIPGVCHGTFGPGATNLSTGVGGGTLDRSALLALTSEVPDSMLDRTTQMKIDQQALFRPLTKATCRLTAEKAAQQVFDFMQIAVEGVPGAVHIGVPSSMANAPCPDDVVFRPLARTKAAPAPSADIEQLAQAVGNSKYPLIALGLRVAEEGFVPQLMELAEKLGAPVVLTPMAKGVFPEDHPCYQGVLFHALSDRLIPTIAKADLIIGIGYDPVEFNYEAWIPIATPLAHVDIVPVDIEEGYAVISEVVGDLGASIRAMIDVATPSRWTQKELHEAPALIRSGLKAFRDRFGPTSALHVLREVMEEDGIMTCDVGAHIHLIGQCWRTPKPRLQLMTNGWSSMGFGIPAAIAAKLCRPDVHVACVTGDGGFLMMAGEIVTARRLKLNVVFVVLADRKLSLISVKQDWQQVPRYETDLYDGEFLKADTVFGAPVLRAANDAEMELALRKAFSMDGPVVVEAVVDGIEYETLVTRKYK
jgi:acetolactate synthase-1/2/3 large subunit